MKGDRSARYGAETADTPTCRGRTVAEIAISDGTERQRAVLDNAVFGVAAVVARHTRRLDLTTGTHPPVPGRQARAVPGGRDPILTIGRGRRTGTCPRPLAAISHTAPRLALVIVRADAACRQHAIRDADELLAEPATAVPRAGTAPFVRSTGRFALTHSQETFAAAVIADGVIGLIGAKGAG